MLVSAISADRSLISRALNTDSTFNSLAAYAKRSQIDKDMVQLYDSINEWKSFCQKQIEAGKLDIIA